MIKKRILTLLLAACLAVGLMPAVALAANNVSYVDTKGAAQTPVNATDISSGTTTWKNGWYYASGNVTINSRVTVSGTVNLILADGANLTINGGIAVNSGNTLIIWGQSGGTGKLTATSSGDNSGIGGNARNSAGTITINGGVISAKGNGFGAAIGGGGDGRGGGVDTAGGGAGNITINGGNVTATTDSGSGAGIGGSPDAAWLNGNIKITGGIITASSLGGSKSGGGVEKIQVSGCPVIVCTGYRNTQHYASWSGGILFTSTGEWATGAVFGNPTLDRDVSIGTLGHEKNVTIPSGSTLTVPSGFIFSTGGGGAVTNEGTIVNNGTFSAAKLDNKGSIQNNNNLKMTASWDGDISVNSGTITNGENGLIKSVQQLTGTGTIVYGIKHELKNITITPDSTTLTHNNTPYTAKLTAAVGYVLPDGIEVYVGGDLLGTSNYTYDSQTGQITIPAARIKGNIRIKAAPAATPLAITKQPMDQFVVEGQRAEFSVEATGDGLTYQWYINRNDGGGWGELDGAIGTAYVTSVADLECDGFQYGCLITDQHGNTIESDVAVLHVSKVPVLPETGDSSAPMFWLAMSILSMAGILLLRKKAYGR